MTKSVRTVFAVLGSISAAYILLAYFGSYPFSALSMTRAFLETLGFDRAITSHSYIALSYIEVGLLFACFLSFKDSRLGGSAMILAGIFAFPGYLHHPSMFYVPAILIGFGATLFLLSFQNRTIYRRAVNTRRPERRHR